MNHKFSTTHLLPLVFTTVTIHSTTDPNGRWTIVNYHRATQTDEQAVARLRGRIAKAKWDAVNEEINREAAREEIQRDTNPEPISLFQLPLEIRHQIYEYLLPLDQRIDLTRERHAIDTACDHLRLSCKQFNREIIAWVYSGSYQRFVRTPDFGWIDPDNTMFEFAITPAFRARHIGHTVCTCTANNLQIEHLPGQNGLISCKWCLITRDSNMNVIRHLKIALHTQDSNHAISPAMNQTTNTSEHDNLILIWFVKDILPRLKTLEISVHWNWEWKRLSLKQGYFDAADRCRLPISDRSYLTVVSVPRELEN